MLLSSSVLTIPDDAQLPEETMGVLMEFLQNGGQFIGTDIYSEDESEDDNEGEIEDEYESGDNNDDDV